MQAKVVEKLLKIPHTEFSQPVICYEKIFLNIFDFIFTIQDFQLKYFTQLPQYAYYVIQGAKFDNCGGQMFSMNNKLYCHNKSSKLFEIKRNGKLKCVNRKHYNLSYYQFRNIVFAIGERKIYLVKSDFQLQSIFDLGKGRIQFVLPGALILYSSLHKNSYVVLNMVNKEIFILPCQNDQVPNINRLKTNIEDYNQFDNHFQFKFRLNACQHFLNYKIEQKTTALTQIDNLLSIQFDFTNKLILQFINLNKKIVSSYQNAFYGSDQ
ncbi:Hypothetical_protein [Hexamita inflata]|uniref:Hypothetical_protein n=1 Tax=Hexamita inflata TaxID=28002 RepID=A0AA86UCC2_9EUKA|nr:Hypothetical protein HINF_LOCUS37694 [Hexamita inflata]